MKALALLTAALAVATALPAVARQTGAPANLPGSTTTPPQAISGLPASTPVSVLVSVPNSKTIATPAPAPKATPVEESANSQPGVNPIASLTAMRPNLLTAALRQMRPVRAILMGSLDSKSAKVGREVELHTREALGLADGTSIPKGSRILGHVTAVEAHAKGSPDAVMAVEFDRAELKGGQTVPILAELRWAEPPPDPSTAAMQQRISSLGGGVMGGATRVQGGMQGNGLGDPSGGGMTISGSMVQMTPKQTEGLRSANDYGVAPPAEVDSAAAERRMTIVSGNHSTPHETGVHGVMLAGSGTAGISGTFFAAGQNVHLDGGTQVLLGLVVVKPVLGN